MQQAEDGPLVRLSRPVAGGDRAGHLGRACTLVAALATSCATTEAVEVDGGRLEGGPPSEDGGEVNGIMVLFADESVGLDHGVAYFNPTTPSLLESYLWSWGSGCDAAMMGTPAQDFGQMFITVRGARAVGSTELRPVAATYPVASHGSPVDPSTATLSFNLMPSGSLRGVSGTVVIESIDADENVTLVVDAVLEDGTLVRGHTTLGRACR